MSNNDKSNEKMNNQNQPSTKKLPVLPLRDVVFFPGVVMPIFIGREASIHTLAKANENGNKELIVIKQKNEDTDTPDIDDLYDVGTLCTIEQVQDLPNGTIKVLLRARERAQVKNWTEQDGTEAEVEILSTPETAPDPEIKILMNHTARQFSDLAEQNKAALPPELLEDIKKTKSPSVMADKIAASAPLDILNIDAKQKLLEIVPARDRLIKIAA